MDLYTSGTNVRYYIHSYTYDIYNIYLHIYYACIRRSNGYYNIFVSVAVCIQYVFWLSFGVAGGLFVAVHTYTRPTTHPSTPNSPPHHGPSTRPGLYVHRLHHHRGGHELTRPVTWTRRRRHWPYMYVYDKYIIIIIIISVNCCGDRARHNYHIQFSWGY